MNLLFIQNEAVLALCWTLIHSLWQGLVLAVITGIVMVATRKANARRRYQLLTGLFFLFIATTVITFIRELWMATGITGTGPILNRVADNQYIINTPLPAASSGLMVTHNFFDQFKDYFNTHASLIVAIWFIIFIARFIKLITELVYVQRLRHYRTNEPSGEWKEKLQELIAKMGVAKSIRLLESGIIKVPVVMGILKPVILVPIGLLSQLPIDEVEAILLHELAHIQRRDYFVNLLQSFAETLFFFNPALIWLSSMIREERENCCDDIAITVTNSKTKFINALIAFQEFDIANTSFAMAFPGKKNQLLDRVKRIISSRNKTLNTTEKSILTLGIAIMIMFSFVAAKKIPVAAIKRAVEKTMADHEGQSLVSTITVVAEKPRNISLETTVSNEQHAIYQPIIHEWIDTIPGPPDAMPKPLSKWPLAKKDTASNNFKSYSTNESNDGETKTLIITAITKQGTEYQLKKINGEMTGFFIDGVQVKENELKNYQDQIDDVEQPYLLKQSHIKLNMQQTKLKHEQEVLKEEKAMLSKIQMKENSMVDGLMQEMKKNNKAIAVTRDELMLQLKKFQLDAIIKDTLDVSVNRKELIEETKKAIKFKTDTLKFKTDKKFYRDGAIDTLKKSPVEAARARKTEAIRQRQENDDIYIQRSAEQIRNIIADLQKENIKIDIQKDWFGLDNNQFVVNGKTMSPELHEKFKTKYLKPNGWGYYYGPVQVTGRGIFMDYQNISQAK